MTVVYLPGQVGKEDASSCCARYWEVGIGHLLYRFRDSLHCLPPSSNLLVTCISRAVGTVGHAITCMPSHAAHRLMLRGLRCSTRT